MKVYKTIAILISALLFASSVFAMSTANERQFRVIMGMSLEELGNTSAKLLKANYPDTAWTDYNFPNYVYGDLATEIAYKVAVKDPELLGISNIQDDEIVIPCYCTCDSFGHDNLLYCFYSHGDSRRGFDEHGAQCGVCIRQALLAYLWSDLGATHAEIMIGMKEKFAPLIEKYHDHEH